MAPAILQLDNVLTPALRADTVAAFNLLRQERQIPEAAHFAFSQRAGKWGLEIWAGPRHHPFGGIAWVACTEVVCAAGPLKLVRGGE